MTQTRRLTPEEHQKAVFYARMVYVVIFFSFVSLCVIAVTVTMSLEKNKAGFHAIKVKQPISFIDQTYVDEKPAH